MGFSMYLFAIAVICITFVNIYINYKSTEDIYKSINDLRKSNTNIHIELGNYKKSFNNIKSESNETIDSLKLAITHINKDITNHSAELVALHDILQDHITKVDTFKGNLLKGYLTKADIESIIEGHATIRNISKKINAEEMHTMKIHSILRKLQDALDEL